MKKVSLQRVGIVIGILALVCLVGLGIVYFSGNQFTVARCIVTTNGSLFMVYEDRPVQLNQKTDTWQTGDKLLILHASDFAESYPEQVKTHFVMKLSSGTKADVPQKALDVLTKTGNWSQGEKPKDTDLEFWITENVESVDWTGHEEIAGWFGAKEYLGRGYKKASESPGGNQHPEYYVSYILTAWPDYADGGWYVTRIAVTDPAVRVCGLTVNSTYEEFKTTFEALGFLVYGNSNGTTYTAEKDGVICRLACAPDFVPQLIVTAKVTNRDGIEF